jgi:holo-[acyl-carrier protein] synthase
VVDGVGIDLVDVDRIERLLKKWDRKFTTKIFTQREIAKCTQRANMAECFAARFAAKEALAKALGHGMCAHFRWKDVEVKNDDSGKPTFSVIGITRNLVIGKRVLLSLTHTDTCAGAMVVVESDATHDL